MRKNEKITALYERLSRDDFGKDDDQQREYPGHMSLSLTGRPLTLCRKSVGMSDAARMAGAKQLPLTGLLYCADCSGKMYVHRTHNGRRRKAYPEIHRPILFNELVLSDKLIEHCAEIDEAAWS